MTRVVVNDFIAARGRSGSSRVAELISEALKGFSDVEVLSPRREPDSRFARLANMLWWDFSYVPFRALSKKATIIVHPTNTGGRLPRQRSIVVMHDTMVLDHPDRFDRGFGIYARAAFGLSARTATVVVTASEHSKRRILDRWPRTSVQVIPWPVERVALEPSPGGHDRRQILIVASADNHKRLPMAIEVVAALRQSTAQPYTLMIVIRRGNDDAAVAEAIKLHDPRGQWITTRTNMSGEELSRMYGQSFCVLVSSIDEGYCLPAVEAGAAGVPVVHTGRGSLPEVTGNHYSAGQQDHKLDRATLLAQCERLNDDSAYWHRESAAGIALTSQLSTEGFAQAWEDLFARLER